MPEINGDNGPNTLLGTSGDDTINGLGGNDTLIGEGGNDILNGGDGDDLVVGESGADQMAGGRGDDRMSVDNPGDTIIELAGEGTDTVISSINFTLAAGVYVERLELFQSATGTNLTGNEFVQSITGNANNNILTGGPSGTAADTMDGQGGDDIYFVNNYGDVVLDSFGDDLVNANVDFTLGAGVAIETLVAREGYGTITLVGNEWGQAIIGNAGINTLIGGAGWDILSGGDSADTLSGGEHTDTLTGGNGTDTFRDTAFGLNSDTITDFSTQDRIVISDANLAGFTFSFAGNTLTFGSNHVTLTGSFNGQFVASAAAEGGVQLTFLPNDVRNDFNGDGRSDILWRHSSGQLADWLGSATGALTPNDASVIGMAKSWDVAGTGDFNGDGRDDVLWRGAAGELTVWQGSGDGVFSTSASMAIGGASTDWNVAGIGDFNGDGRDDILWRNTAGDTGTWLGSANGMVTYNSAAGVVAVPSYWQIEGVGDFNGDGRDDILWRGNSGEVGTWLGDSNGALTYNVAAGVAASPSDWHIVGVGDFNGDNRDDIVWRSDQGEVGTWLANANGSFTANNAQVVSVPTSWHIADVGDFNGDNIDDLLWRHDNGDMTNWLGQQNGIWLENNGNALAFIPMVWTIEAADVALI